MRVEFVIDDLVLDGFDPRDRHRIADEVRSALTTWLAHTDVRRLVGGPPQVDRLLDPDMRSAPPEESAHPGNVGTAVALSVAAAIMPVSGSSGKRGTRTLPVGPGS